MSANCLLLGPGGDRSDAIGTASPLSMNRPSERGQLCPRDPTSTDSRTRLSALLPMAGSWPRCAISNSWKLSMNHSSGREVLECGGRAQRRHRFGPESARGNQRTHHALESAVVAPALSAQSKPLTRGGPPRHAIQLT
jgi:hypothetical protein